MYEGKALVNSVTGEDEQMERVLPLVARHGAAVVAISNDETGISEDPDVRFEVARKIVSRAEDHGIRREDVVVDPLVMPIGAMGTAGRQVFSLVRRLRDELRVNTTCGASNVSFGLPNRTVLNAAFLPMAIASGLTSAITSPLHSEMLLAVKAADVMMGNDAHCADWIARNGERGAGATSGRRGGRAARRAGGRDVSDALVVFTPSGRRARVERGTTVLDAARRLGVDLDSVCGGRGICGRCQVAVSDGEHAKHGIACTAEALTAVTERRAALRRRAPARARVAASAVRHASPPTSSSTSHPRARCTARSSARRPTRAPIEVDPVVRLYHVEVEEPQLATATSDATRLLAGARARVGPRAVSSSLPALLKDLQTRASQGRVERHGRRARRGDGRPPSGPASTTPPTGSRSTSARRRSPGTSATSGAARSSPRRAR